MYILDASALIDLKDGYPREVTVFQPIWDRMGCLASEGVLIAPRDAYLEVAKGTDDAAAWVRLHEHLFIDIDQELGEIMTEVWREVPEMDKDKQGPHADPWCLALAVREVRRGNEVHVLSHEHKRGTGRIPAGCRKLKLSWIKLPQFFRLEAAAFAGTVAR